MELKPCPFCGEDAAKHFKVAVNIRVPSDPSDFRFVVICTNCLARGPVCMTEGNADQHWNRRRADA